MTRHARPCAGHPRRHAAASPDETPRFISLLLMGGSSFAAWMPGTRPGMTAVGSLRNWYKSTKLPARSTRRPSPADPPRRRPHGSLLFRNLSPVNRDRGEPRGSAPPTPPYVRVRIRRFGGLSLPPCGRTEGRGFVSRIAAAASVPAPPGCRASPSGLGGQAGQYRSSAAWPPRDACRYSPLPPFGPSSGRPDYYALC